MSRMGMVAVAKMAKTMMVMRMIVTLWHWAE